MENEHTNVEDLYYKLKEYADLRLDLFKLKGIKKASDFFSTLTVIIILLVLLFIVIICFTIGIALLLGEWLGHSYYGFLIMGGLYIIIGLILYSARDKFLKLSISDKLIKELLED
ncbi:MAG TPA: phage holin family protein [Hanamia sp.]